MDGALPAATVHRRPSPPRCLPRCLWHPRDIPDFSNRREVGVDPQRVCIDEHFAEVANKRQGIAAAIATRMTGLDVYARPSR